MWFCHHSVSYSEYNDALRKLNMGLGRRDIDLLIAAADPDLDGRIEYKELVGELTIAAKTVMQGT